MQAWFTQLVKATKGIKQGSTPAGPRKPPVPPKPNITPSAKKKLKFTPQVSSADLAEGLPGTSKSTSIYSTLSPVIKKHLRKKAAEVAKKKGKSWAKKALDWKSWKTP